MAGYMDIWYLVKRRLRAQKKAGKTSMLRRALTLLPTLSGQMGAEAGQRDRAGLSFIKSPSTQQPTPYNFTLALRSRSPSQRIQKKKPRRSKQK